MLKLYINENHEFLGEDIDAAKKYYPNIDDDMFMRLIQLDPTYRGNQSLGKYGKWILNLYNKGNLSEDDMNSITDVLNQFTTYRNRIQNKDLNSYKSLSDLEDILATVVDDDSMLTDRQKLRFLKNVKAGRTKISAEDNYDIVLETPNFIVYVPNTHEASMKLGKGTDWCTAHENPKWYSDYTQDGGKLYIIKNKHTGERWQYSDSTNDFLDEDDLDFDVTELVTQDDKLYQWYCNIIGFDPSKPFIYTQGMKLSKSVKAFVKDITVADNVTEIGKYAFMYCTELQNVTIPTSVEIIRCKAFWDCVSLKVIKMPDSVKRTESCVFAGCINAKLITLSKNLTKISMGMFEDCKSLTHITIPKSVTEINSGAFKNCKMLKSVTIPDKVEYIDDDAFNGCENLSTVIIPNSVKCVGMDCFKHCSDNLTIYTNNEYFINEVCIPNNIKWRDLPNANESYKGYRKRVLR